MGFEIVENGPFEFAHALEGTAANAPRGNLGEEPFHQVQPRRASGGEVYVPVRAPGEPVPDLGCLMGAVVVHDQVNVQAIRNVGFDGFEEFEELLLPVAAMTGTDNFACRHVQGGKQRGRTVTDVIVASAFGVARRHGQERLGAVQGLNLGLLVDAEDHGSLGRIHVEPHDIADFLDE